MDKFGGTSTHHNDAPTRFSVDYGVHVKSKWSKASTHLAVASDDGCIDVYDRTGRKTRCFTSPVKGTVLHVDWDFHDKKVAVAYENERAFAVADVTSTSDAGGIRRVDVESSIAAFSCSGEAALAAAVTECGAVFIYETSNFHQVASASVETKGRVTSVMWLGEPLNHLLLGFDTGAVSQLAASGKLVSTSSFGEPVVSFFHVPGTSFSVLAGHMSVCAVKDGDPVTLAGLHSVDPRQYGRIMCAAITNDRKVFCGTADGNLHCASMGEHGDLSSSTPCGLLSDPITCISYNESSGKLALASGSKVYLLSKDCHHECSFLVSETDEQVDDDRGSSISEIAWAPDGTLFTVVTRLGHAQTCQGFLPAIAGVCGSRIVQLNGLNELSIYDVTSGCTPVLVGLAPLSTEVDTIAVGPAHVSVLNDTHVQIFSYDNNGQLALNAYTHEFSFVPSKASLGASAAAIECNDRVFWFKLNGDEIRPLSTSLIDVSQGLRLASATASAGSFFYCTMSNGLLQAYDSQSTPAVCIAKHQFSSSILSVWPSPRGTHAVIIEETGKASLFNLVDESCLSICSAPTRTKWALWDFDDPSCFVLCSLSDIAVFVHLPLRQSGPAVQHVGLVEILENGELINQPFTMPYFGPDMQCPIFLSEGALVFAVGGLHPSLQAATLPTHQAIGFLTAPADSVPTVAQVRAAFAQHLALQHLEEAYNLAAILDERPCWLALCKIALDSLDLSISARSFYALGNVKVTDQLFSVIRCEDSLALTGEIAAVFEECDKAKNHLMQCGLRRLAVDFFRGTHNWEKAIEVAKQDAPLQLAVVFFEAARASELSDDLQQACSLYELAFENILDGAPAALRSDIVSGLVRVYFRTSQVACGVRFLQEVGDPSILQECASILEANKDYQNAALLYARLEQWAEAARLYLLSGDYLSVMPLLERLTDSGVLASYGKCAEAALDYSEAVKSYERAGAHDAVVRLLCDHLDDIHRAATIVRKTRSAGAARSIAGAMLRKNDARAAVEFLVLGDCREDAFLAAAQHGEMETYMRAMIVSLEDSADDGATKATSISLENIIVKLPPDEAMRVCTFYATSGKHGTAARLHTALGEVERGLELLMQDDSDVCLDQAIQLVTSTKDPKLTRTLIDHLSRRDKSTVSETTGLATESHSGLGLLFKIHTALGNFDASNCIALDLARTQQTSGNYKSAHRLLFKAWEEIVGSQGKVSPVLYDALLLVHSYILVKRLVRVEDHVNAARLMVRVATSIDKFPVHIVPILTSTVIECQRAGMRKSAHQYACTLMTTEEYRCLIDEKFRKKIEDIVRRPSSDEADEPSEPCPFCNTQLPVSLLWCQSCKNNIPFCIATGKHMTIAGCSACPHCLFPALQAPFASQLSSPPSIECSQCPMCNTELSLQSLSLARDPRHYLQRLASCVSSREP